MTWQILVAIITVAANLKVVILILNKPNRTIEFWYWAEEVATSNAFKVMFDGASKADGQAIYILQFRNICC